MRVAFTFALAMALCACQPSDQTGKTVKQRLDEGDIVEHSEGGFHHPGCRIPGWKLSLTDESERHRVVLGKQQSIIHPGIYSCYEVGSRVNVDIYKKAGASGRVEIVKLSWLRVDFIRKNQLAGKYFSSSEQFNQYMSGIKTRLDYRGEHYVTIVDFKYLPGSASDEKSIQDEDKSGNQGDGFEETTDDGDSLSNCKKAWSDLIIAPEFQNAVLSGQLASWFQLGKRNCFKQGQEVTVKASLDKDEAATATITIRKIKRLRVTALDKKYFKLNGFDYATLLKHIQEVNARKGEDFITIVDFDLSKQVSP